MRMLFLLLLVAGPALAGGPILDQAGFEAEAHGAALGYPVPARGQRPTDALMVGYYTRYDTFTRTRTIERAGPVSALDRGDAPPELRWTVAGAAATLEDYVARAPVTGLLIAQGHSILYERYRYARTEQDRFLSQSMAKTVTGLLVGIAVQEGSIRSIDDTAATYATELSGSAYGGTSIRDLLHMASGMQFRETYQPGDDNDRLGRSLFASDVPGSALRQFETRAAVPGTLWHYSGADTETLGLVVARATGMTLSAYASSRLWGPMGMEADAAWATDRTGQEIAYCCLVARLRDWARLGLMLAHGGAWNGRQIVPSAWLQNMVSAPPEAPWAVPRAGGYGYGYQIWLLPGVRPTFALMGIHGQRVLIDPAAHLVLVQTAVFPEASGATMREVMALWRALLARFPA